MTYLAPRKGKELAADPTERICSGARPLADYRDAPAFVLLGDPGLGKTTTFEHEAKATTSGFYITARDFVCLNPRSEWSESVLFIDGLDEIRAGGEDGRSMLDKVRRRLDQFGRPRFRISCRSASWYGSNDREHLKRVSPDGNVHVIMLEPLSESDIGRILKANYRIGDGDRETFLEAVECEGISGLLSNPLNLKLVAKVSTANRLPSTQRELMVWACGALLRERNEEHQNASQELLNTELLLNRAGYLSTLLILTGSVGYSLFPQSDSGYLEIVEVPERAAGIDRSVVASGLFHGVGEGLFEPIHRHLMEYLAARYVADRLKDGLPIGRMAALISSHDGEVQSVFHGFVAWLSELCPVSRPQLLVMEPAGIVANADVSGFERSEKRLLLRELLRMAEQYPPSIGVVLAGRNLGSLVSADAAPDVVELFTTLEPCEAHQPRAIVLTEVLRQVAPIPSIAPLLLDMVRNSLWSRQARLGALRATVVQLGSDTPAALDELLRLADEIKSGLVSDESDEILGFVLPKLYPHTLRPNSIVQYLHTPLVHSRLPVRSYVAFWGEVVKNRSNQTELAELLNALVDRHNELRNWDSRTAKTVREVVLIILGHFLTHCRTAATLEQLFNWIGTAVLSLESRTYEFGVYQPESQIRDFLRSNDDVRLELARLQAGQQHNADRSDLNPLLFLDVSLQDSHGSELFASSIGEDASVSRINAGQPAASSIDPENPQALYQTALKNEVRTPVPARGLTDMGRKVLGHLGKGIDEVQTSAQSGMHPVPPELLLRIAAVYHGIGEEAHGLTPLHRLRNFLGEEEGVVESVVRQFRDAAIATDVPDEREVLRLSTQNPRHLYVIALPCLAGLSEMAEIKWQNDAQIRRAIAIYFTTRRLFIHLGKNLPPWFDRVVKEHHALVAKVYIKYAVAVWANSRFPPAELTTLIYRERFELIARLIILPLLSKLPVRSSHIHSLQHLLHGAIRLSSGEELTEIIDLKLSAASMTQVQRVWWLAAGLWIAPEAYAERLEVFVKGKQRRIQHLARAIRLFESAGTELITPDVLGLLVQLTAPCYDPIPLHESSVPLGHQRAAKSISGMIRALGDWPSQAALDALKRLEQDPSVFRWHYEIQYATSKRRMLLNAHTFKYPDANSVADVLANRAPFSARDLAALTTDVLNDLAQQVRTGHTSDWRQYWNVDSWGRPIEPKPENSCRDALASDLGLKLRHWNISVHVEAVHANGMRSDILICYEEFKIPIEIKRSCNRQLWDAMPAQLVAKYCIEPDSRGFGMYVVLWFGNVPECRLARKDGYDPHSAEELEACLIDTLSGADRHRVTVLVVDVAMPKA